MVLIPLDDHVLVKPIAEPTTTASGLIMSTSTAKEKPSKGTVISLGDGKLLDDGTRVQPNVQIGDTVYFNAYSPDEIIIEGESYLVIKSTSLLAKAG